MERFLSMPWMEAYAAHCSADEALAAALKGFNASIEEYGWLDREYPNVYLTLVNGLPQSVSETLPKKAQLRVHASRETWMRIHQRELSGKKAFPSKRHGLRRPYRGRRRWYYHVREMHAMI
ncbi:hypothetical protein [Acidithiobacillus thiooxidans]|uniref:hypothetical protein n=1 Tax=Acidithiobacillus thiooxidans TaxID=930 RepID=UPI002432C84B|nr:hypothetical protein [Acidithiobacillus thiooxidans]